MSEQLKHIAHARTLFSAGRFSDAAEAWRVVVAESPTQAAAREALGHSLLAMGELPEALAAFEFAARQYASQQETLKALALCKVILDKDPKRATAHRLLAELHAGLKGETHARQPAPAPPTAVARAGIRSVAVTAEQAPVIPVIPLFSELGRAAFLSVTSHAKLRHFPSDHVVVREGDSGDAMFAIVKGSVEVRRADADGQLVALASLDEGAFFGEMALISGAARMATVVAVEDCTLLEFGRADMEQVVAQHPSVGRVLERFHRRRLISSLVRSSEIFRLLPAQRREELAEAFRARSVAKGTVIIEQGKRNDAFYMVLRGGCSVHKNGVPVGELTEGGVFGEISLLFGVNATATVVASSACTLLRLTRNQFETLVLTHEEARALLMKLGTQRQQIADEPRAQALVTPPASW